MRRLAAILIGLSLAFPVLAQTIVRITAVPTPAGVVSSKFRDGDDSGASGPSTPELGNPQVIDDDEVLLPLFTAATGGTSPLTYELSLSTTDAVSGFSVVDANVDFGTDNVYLLSGLTPETQHWVQLAAIDAALRRSGNSQVRTFTTLAVVGGDVTAPTQPTNPSCTSTVANRNDCTCTASTDAVGVTKYIIRRGLGDGAGNVAEAGAVIAEITGTPPACSHTDTSVSGGQEYFYRFQAADAAGNLSTRSDFEFVTTASGSSGAVSAGTGFEEFPVGFVFDTNNYAMALGSTVSGHATSGDHCVVQNSIVLNGTRSLMCTIPANSSGGSGGDWRAELTFSRTWGWQGGIEGERQCIGYNARYLPDFPNSDNVGTVLVQTHKGPNTVGSSPSHGLRNKSGNQIYYTPEVTGGPSQQSLGIAMSGEVNQTRRWVMDITFSMTNQGATAIYRNGAQLYSVTGARTLEPGTTVGHNFKIGLYSAGCKSGNCDQRRVVLDDIRFARGANCPAAVQ